MRIIWQAAKSRKEVEIQYKMHQEILKKFSAEKISKQNSQVSTPQRL